jgi:hypothetical protein
LSGNVDWQTTLNLSDVPDQMETGVGFSYEEDYFLVDGSRSVNIALGTADADAIIKES